MMDIKQIIDGNEGEFIAMDVNDIIRLREENKQLREQNITLIFKLHDMNQTAKEINEMNYKLLQEKEEKLKIL